MVPLNDIPNLSVLQPLPHFGPAALGECEVPVPELVKRLVRGLMRIGILDLWLTCKTIGKEVTLNLLSAAVGASGRLEVVVLCPGHSRVPRTHL